jgi:hypothetical protein
MTTDNFNILVQYEKQMGLSVVPLPVRTGLTKIQLYPSGLLMELLQRLIKLEPNTCVQVNYEALTNSNISTMHGQAKMLGYKLHCLRDGEKRILYTEKMQ